MAEREKTTIATFNEYFDLAIQAHESLPEICEGITNKKMKTYLLIAFVLHFFNKESGNEVLASTQKVSIDSANIKHFADTIKKPYAEAFKAWIESGSSLSKTVGAAWNLIPRYPEAIKRKDKRSKTETINRGLSTGVDLATKLIYLADFFLRSEFENYTDKQLYTVIKNSKSLLIQLAQTKYEVFIQIDEELDIKSRKSIRGFDPTKFVFDSGAMTIRVSPRLRPANMINKHDPENVGFPGLPAQIIEPTIDLVCKYFIKCKNYKPTDDIIIP